MPLLPCITNSGPSTSLFGLRGATGLPPLSTIVVSSILVEDGEIGMGNGQYISTIGNQLYFFNGTVLEPISALSSISSLEEWSLYPAISTIDADLQNLDNVSSLAANEVLTMNLAAGEGYVSTLAVNNLYASTIIGNSLTVSSIVAQDISTVTLTAISTIHVISTISSATVEGALAKFSTGQFGDATISTILKFRPYPSTTIALDATPSTFTISQQVNSVIPNQVTLNAQTGTILYSSQPVYVPNILSTPALYVSSINGAEFTSTTITVELGQFSSIATQSISSLGAEIRQALMSSIVFSPSLNPSLGGVNVNLGLGGLLGNIVGWGAGVFGAAAGVVGLITGITALATGRQTQQINNNYYETVNGTTQLQFSTLGTPFSTIYRINSSADPQTIPGEEILVSTINPPGLAIRSISDPLYTLSTPSSTIQAFGQWVPVPEANPSSISTVQDWALFPALSSVSFAVGVPAVVQSGQPIDNIAIKGANIQLVGDYTDAKNLLLVSSLSSATLLGANDNLFNNFLSTPGLKIDAANLFLSTPVVIHPGFFNGSTIGANSGFVKGELSVSTLTASTITVPIIDASVGISSAAVSSGSLLTGSLNITGLSTINFQTTAAAGTQGQPAGRLVMTGNDVDLGQQDLWCQQVRVGAGQASAPGTAEVSFYDVTGARVKGLLTGSSDTTIRISDSTTPGVNSPGYLLDTRVNPPFFSTINQSTALMAFFPSTSANTIGVSTLSFMPPKVVAGAFTSLSTQVVPAADTPFAIAYTDTDLSIGGISFSTTAIVIPAAGVYEIGHSIQLDKSGGGVSPCDFWFRKNGVDVPNSASQVTVQGNTGEVLGTISLIIPLVANDKLELVMASSDNTMAATFFQSTVTTPYTRPAVPSLITNVKCLNY